MYGLRRLDRNLQLHTFFFVCFFKSIRAKYDDCPLKMNTVTDCIRQLGPALVSVVKLHLQQQQHYDY